LQDGCILMLAFIVAKDVSIQRRASVGAGPFFSDRRLCTTTESPFFLKAAATLVNFCFRQKPHPAGKGGRNGALSQLPKLVLGVKFNDGIEVIAKPTGRQPITAAA
jgi:hypothetical protein